MKPSFVLYGLLSLLVLTCLGRAQTSYVFTKLDLLGSNVGGISAISGSNAIVTYIDINGNPASFLYNAGRYTLLDDIVAYKNTYATGISGSTVFGAVENNFNAGHGFIYSNGSFTVLSYPSAQATMAVGMSGSTVVGVYSAANKNHGYKYVSGTYTTIDYPSARNTAVSGIAGNNIVGSYTDTSNVHHGFLYNGTTYTSITYPGSIDSETAYVDGNNVIGVYHTTSANKSYLTGRGFLYNSGTYTSILYPSSVETLIAGISGNLIVGSYTNTTPSPRGNFGLLPHGFIYNIASQTYTTVDVPGSRETSILSVSGTTIAGAYEDMDFIYHGFIGVPSTRTLTISGPLNFSATPINTTATETLTITNTGTAPVTISGITYPTAYSGSAFQPLAPGNSEQITVSFTPTSVASYSGNITVTSNATTSPNTLAVSGNGTNLASLAMVQPTAAQATSGSSAVPSEPEAEKAPVPTPTLVSTTPPQGVIFSSLRSSSSLSAKRRQVPIVNLDTTTVPGSSFVMLTYRQAPDLSPRLFHLEVSYDLRTWTAVTPDLSHRIGTDPATGDSIMEVGIKAIAGVQQRLRLTEGSF